MSDEQQLFALGTSTLAKLDRGAAAVALDKALERAVADCLDRPTDDRARKVILTLEVRPVKEVHENTVSCEGARGTYKVRYRQPDWESQELDFGVRKTRAGGMLVFSELSPANHRQTILPLAGGEDDDS